jgi:hypothetical protein
MVGADDFFATMRTQGMEAQRVAQQASFEESVIKQLLRNAGVDLNVGQAKRESKDEFQADSISFAWFNSRYPQFPVLLAASKLPFTSGTHIGWTELFHPAGVRNLPWHREYEKTCATYNWDLTRDRAALLFNAPHLPGGGIMAYHNQIAQAGYTEAEQRNGSTRALLHTGQVTLVLETFKSFLLTVGTTWLG